MVLIAIKHVLIIVTETSVIGTLVNVQNVKKAFLEMNVMNPVLNIVSIVIKTDTNAIAANMAGLVLNVN